MVEIWKPVLDYIGLYEVSNLGRVRSLDRWIKYSNGKLRFFKGSILKLKKDKYGYLKAHLCKNSCNKFFSVHRLVWEAFNGEIPEGYEINHINEDKTDNRYPENLNLMTRKENANWGTANQRRADKQSQAILQLTYPEGKFIKEWSSMAEAERKTGISHANISNCCNGKCKQANGFKWVKKINYKMVG